MSTEKKKYSMWENPRAEGFFHAINTEEFDFPDFKFEYSKQNDLDEVFAQIYKNSDFSYNIESDPLYQQFRAQAINQGQKAMKDTMGQASAMTGGYGNSYAATAGNQAYQEYLESLNDIVPELYQLAYDKHNQKNQDILNKYSVLSQEKESEYEKNFNEFWQDYSRKYREYRDNVADEQYNQKLLYDFLNNYENNNDTENVESEELDYSDWDEEMWYEFFSEMRLENGEAYAMEILGEMLSSGELPREKAMMAALGAREPGFLGH